MRRKIFNIEVDNLSMKELLAQFQSGVLVTPNVDHLILLQENRTFWDAYRRADFVTVDSQIVFMAMRFLGTPVKEKVSGSDVLPAYCNYHRNNPAVRIFLLGGREGVAHMAMDRINQNTGRQIVVGAHSPSMQFVQSPDECDRVIDMIRQSGANVLVVGLGAPKQELWIDAYRNRLPEVRSFMALGATLDFEAGTVQRAPQWMSKAGLEWLFRLLMEPGRLWRRYLVRDPYFFWLLLKQRFGRYRSPFA